MSQPLRQSGLSSWRALRPLFLAITASVLLQGAGFRSSAAAESQPPAAGPRTAEDLEAEELARDVFSADDYWWKRTETVKSPTLLATIWSWIYEHVLKPIGKALLQFLNWLFKLIFGLTGLDSSGDWSSGVPYIKLALVVALLIVAWRLYVAWRRRPMAAAVEAAHPAVESLPRPLLLLEEAQNLLVHGDSRQAIRHAFLALLAWFQECGRLIYDPSRCNREYQRDLRPWPELSASFRAAADPFERCWYGGREIEPAQVEAVISLCRRHLQEGERDR